MIGKTVRGIQTDPGLAQNDREEFRPDRNQRLFPVRLIPFEHPALHLLSVTPAFRINAWMLVLRLQ